MLGQPPFPDSQPGFVRDIVRGAQVTGIGGRVGAPTRYGKTGCAISAAIELGGSVLALTNNAMVADQWAETWNRWVVNGTGVSIPAGRIQRDRLDLPPKYPFVVGMMQTLLRRPLSEEARSAFRTIILDEADCAPFAIDWRRLFPGRAAAVARPARTEQVAAIVGQEVTLEARLSSAQPTWEVLWRQIGGNPVELLDDLTLSPSFIAPPVPTTLIFRVTGYSGDAVRSADLTVHGTR